MSNPGRIELRYSDEASIYLYDHWGADSLEDRVAEALSVGRDRWGDEEYLARIIFSRLIQDDVLGTTGYGIATVNLGDLVVIVDMGNRVIWTEDQTEVFVDFRPETYEEFLGRHNEKA